MKTYANTLTGALLVMAGCLAAEGAVQAATPYETAVPAEYRSLVSESSYKDVLKRLDGVPSLSDEKRSSIAASPCANSIASLLVANATDPVVHKALQMASDGMQDPPPSAAGQKNIWKGLGSADALAAKLADYTLQWCVALPQISGNSDDGMKYIGPMYWFYYKNLAGKNFAQGRDPANPANRLPNNFDFLKQFSVEAGAFMDSPASTKNIGQWIADPRIEIADYPRQKASDYKSWNDFFSRIITMDEATQTIPSRPSTMPLSQYPERDYIIVSPTDCIMNPLIQSLDKVMGGARKFIDNPLQLDTVLDIKNIPISVDRLLGNAPDDLKKTFVGGTGVSCILMPNTYHNFHSPVNGTVEYAEVVKGTTFGYDDWPNLMPSNHNPAQPGTDFSEFEVYQRGVVIIKVQYANTNGSPLTGYVASIPVGLDTIGSVVLDPAIKPGAQLTRGFSRIGNFLYGGSMNVLLFSNNLATGSVQTRLGNQIGIINIGTTPTGK
ncbi:phosphatidylserine decarboxylase [Azospirillum sp. sgz302134]